MSHATSESSSLVVGPTRDADLSVAGMTCASCVARVERALQKVDGVVSASVNLATERANVTYVPAAVDLDRLASAITEAGYEVIGLGADEEAGLGEDTGADRQRGVDDQQRADVRDDVAHHRGERSDAEGAR